MATPRTHVSGPSGSSVCAQRIRPLLGPDLSSEDGLVDWVVVDCLLRGEFVETVRMEELDEVCRILDELRVEYHGQHAVRPGTRFNDNSPYRQTLASVAHALGDTEQEFQARMTRWRDKMDRRRKRALKRQEADSNG